MNAVPTNLEFHPDTWERTFFWEEEPVLLCSLTLPVFDRPSTRAGRRVSNYYVHLSRWLRSLWEQQVFPAACAALQSARDASLPFHPFRETVTFQVTRNGGGWFSLYWDSAWYTGGAHGMTARWGDTWDLTTGCPMSLSDFFPPRAEVKKLLPALAEQQAAAAMAAGTSLYDPNYAELLRKQFDCKRFYIDDHTLFFFYPLCSVAPYAEGVPVFSVPMEDGRVSL